MNVVPMHPCQVARCSRKERQRFLATPAPLTDFGHLYGVVDTLPSRSGTVEQPSSNTVGATRPNTREAA